jgi:transcriptional regulator with XRE-family HTH domain
VIKGLSAKAGYRFRLKPGVRRAIPRLNISQNELARQCGLTSGHLSQLLSGQRFAGPTVRAKLLAALAAFEFDELFEEVP